MALMATTEFHSQVINMGSIKYFNVNLNLDDDGIAEGAYDYTSNSGYAFNIKENEHFNYKKNSYDVWDRLHGFLKDHNPVSKLTENNISRSYVTSYFECVRTDELYEAIHKYAEVYEDLYNGYCNDTARGGKSTRWNGITPIPVMTSPVSVGLGNGETYKNDDAEIFVKIRGIPVPMRKYKLSDNTLMWKFPEYAFAFRNGVECIESMIPSKDIMDGSYTHRNLYYEPDKEYNTTEFRSYGATAPNYTQVNSDNTTEIRLGVLNIVR